ncbi:hypothetical protein RHSIM_Rhsim06G0194100 [Rhododendron simsii]|uniref:Terpene synthase metal-binding domain-containing protein n=1 Tax=Rhododendron simsii TaxID=118357 RepID=A0A834H413_RHOSS|nr:hypothetical protein RHSIM_Rhsim06G0194100 [Rhododendron simsii]
MSSKFHVKDMTRGYLAEAKWYHEGYVPSFEEYMPTAMLSGGQQALAITFLVGMGELATKEALDWLYTDPLIVQGASVVGRLMDDVVGHEVPSMDEHMPIALLSCGHQAVSIISLIGMGELATKEAFHWVSS